MINTVKKSEVAMPTMSNINDICGTILKQLYLKNMSYDELSKQSGVSKPFITSILTGRSIPSSTVAIKLAAALGFNEDTFLDMCFKVKMERRNKKLVCYK